jgi:hypothetical protein
VKKILAIVGVLMVLPIVAMADPAFEGVKEFFIAAIFGLFTYPWCIIFGVGAIVSKKPVTIQFIVTVFMVFIQILLNCEFLGNDKVPLTHDIFVVIAMFVPLCFALAAGLYNALRTG